MKLQLQPNRWSCLATSTAMILDITLDQVIIKAGHDGSKIHWPEEPEPRRRQGFHIEEMQYVALSYGVFLVPYVPRFGYNPGGNPKRFIKEFHFDVQWKEVMQVYDGLLLGKYSRSPNHHAVAWNAREQVIYDPKGCYSLLDTFDAESFHAAIRTRG